MFDRRPLLLAPLAILAGLIVSSLSAAPAHADVKVEMNPGQRVVGEVPTRLIRDEVNDRVRRVSELIRIQLPLVQDSEPRLRLTLSGSPVVVSFLTTQLFDPDGQLVPSSADGSTGPRYRQSIRSGRSTLRMDRYRVAKTGTYELRIETNAAVRTNIGGKLNVARRKKLKFTRSADELAFVQDFLDGDKIKVIVKGPKRGAVPDLLSFSDPDDTTLVLREGFSKKLTKRGAKTALLEVRDTGPHTFALGFQPGSDEGEFNGVVRLTPAKATSLTKTVQIRLANPPGIEIGVREFDRRIEPTFAPDGGIGVAFGPGAVQGGIVHISGEESGDIVFGQYTPELDEVPTGPGSSLRARVAGVVHNDTPGNDPVQGHRLIYSQDIGFLFVGWSTASGTRLGLTQVRTDNYLRFASTEVVAQSVDPIADVFLTGTDQKLFLGFPLSAGRHRIHQLSLASVPEATYDIGGGAFGHAAGASATFDRLTNRIEFWAPDTPDGAVEGGIHRQLYSTNWTSIVNEEIADELGVTEFQPTASTRVEIADGNVATVLHYVVDGAPEGDGQIHRRIYDTNGVEVPGSAAVLTFLDGTPRTGLSQPVSAVGETPSGAPVLFLAYDSPTGHVVERLPLVITPLD